MTQDIYDHLPSWPDFVERVLAVLVLSLEMLHRESNLPTKEVPLNVRLTRCVRRANIQLNQVRLGLPWPCTFDGVQGLSADNEELVGFEETRPDFSWGLLNPQETDLLFYERHFDIECKRLGLPSSRTWILNERYVLDGIHRFMREEHSYGRGVERGAMIGYVQSMELDDVLSEVNAHGLTNDVPVIHLEAEWSRDISRLQHNFDRDFALSPFQLDHFWLDLRGRCS